MASGFTCNFVDNLIDSYSLQRRRSINEEEFENIYPINLIQSFRDEMTRTRVCEFDYTNSDSPEVNILLIGTTGSGKTTSINALMNFLANVSYDDEHRLEIVDLEETERRSYFDQSQSQTDWISVYKIGVISSHEMPYRVNIVDTPGFGDTRGMDKDIETMENMREFLHNCVHSLHAVCLVLNGTLPRLDERQEYIFDLFQNVFGPDIRNNLFIWATFTDYDDPPVLSAVNDYGIRYSNHFTFENGSLYKKIPDNKRKRERDETNFEDAQETFKSFLNTVKDLEPLDLQLLQNNLFFD